MVKLDLSGLTHSIKIEHDHFQGINLESWKAMF